MILGIVSIKPPVIISSNCILSSQQTFELWYFQIMFSPDPSDYCNVHQSIVEFLRMVGLKPEPYYMSESDGPLRDRLKSLYKPEILSKNCEKNQRQPGLQSVSFSCSLGSQPLTRCTASNRHRLSMLFTRRDWSPNPCQVERLQNLRRNCWGPLSRSQVSASSFTSMALDFHANRFRQLGRDKVPVTEGLM